MMCEYVRCKYIYLNSQYFANFLNKQIAGAALASQ